MLYDEIKTTNIESAEFVTIFFKIFRRPTIEPFNETKRVQ